MSLHDQVAAAFAPDGWLSRAEPHFRPRAGQTAMALAVVQTIDNPVIDTYVRLKGRYAEDILVEFELHKVSSKEVLTTIDFKKIDKNLLPWRKPYKNAFRLLMNFKRPKFTYNLACYCDTYEKAR